jgi:radical SAM superfamily enzyme
MVAAVHIAQKAGLRVSVIGILGLGGPELSEVHARATGQAVSAMDPDYFALLTLMLVPGTKLHHQWQAGRFQLMRPKEMLFELRQVLYHLTGLSHCVFRTNHASNYLSLAGTLSRDRAALLSRLDGALESDASTLRPESWRAL